MAEPAAAALLRLRAFTQGPAWLALALGPFVLGMAVFAWQTATRGVQRSARVAAAGGSYLLGAWVKELGYWYLTAPARLCVRAQVAPTTITLAGLAVVLVGCGLVAGGWWGLGGLLLLVGSMSDMLDGLVARRRNLCSDRGEFVDAMVDRVADVAVPAALCIYYGGRPWAQALVLAALIGSVMVSYGRAKAESLGVTDAPGGQMRRAERAVYLGFGTLLSPSVARLTEGPAAAGAPPIYWLQIGVCSMIAVLANASAWRLSQHVMRRLQRPAP